MRPTLLFLKIAFLLTLQACNSSESENQQGITIIKECKSPPKYLPLTGFIRGQAFGFSIAEKGAIGLSLVQYARPGVPYKRFSFPSWEKAGHLGAVVTDQEGNNYVIPRPFINTLRNDPKLQNIVYKVDSESGDMTEFVNLPSLRPATSSNPYGLLGLSVDCETQMLYASSVLGSDISNISGSLYAISPEGKIVSTFSKVDAMGVGIAYLNGKKNLFFGDARGSEVLRLELDKNGKFEGQPIPVLSLKLLGERGDDKPRKIRFNEKGEMVVSGISFNFNLANSPDRLENIYTFRYDGKSQWLLTGIAKGQM